MKIDYEKYRDNKSSHAYHPSVRLRNNFTIHTLKNLSFETLLDVWCGDWYLLSQIQLHFPNSHLTWFDYSQKVIEKNQHQYKDISFEAHDLWIKLHTSSTFDVVVCSEVIEHIQDWHMVIENLVSVTKPGWYIILTTQAGHRYPSDIENGHVKHFLLSELDGGFIAKWCTVKFSYRKWYPFYDLQKYVHSKMLKAATNIQEWELTPLRKILFSFVYHLFTLTPRTKTLWTQIYTMYQKKY